MSGKNRKKPNIVVSEIDYERLMGLATNVSERLEEIAEELMAELDRAKVVPAKRLPQDVIHMGSTVEFRSNDGQQRRVTLVYPGEADIAQGKISILTPIGTALIGLAPGQSISWTARDGKQHELNVLSVSNEVEVATATPAAE
ncbi:nucleoside diphosphate kinase regulator [Brucella intermedia]|uniref:Nucleoside diphosphate kinase regulator n=2 Tax=Brucella/Ochrobactrum group TaxID=2826938 RepID=A0AA42H671_9HYPH|nr:MULTISPECIES: nucleoside diphosphate kinase regulator [Brucella/Ochrobactrum group]ERI13253.1 nucleoside diphosphate kinase regulator [Ochrobactrum sp. EGD-AQ16]PJT22957.1 nucleoside diphosphate kinase regulator [Ochrobactrum sp. 30A/1000/2015]PJT37819.1 nucleoside diphosphate kinase regulator [Ochrobactrum sp. 27A/999/2015]PJT42665.1 nucleoside diphosphate kinase regulator [Ochrobactrum sp. 23A/997/2015]BBA73127.1 nucleoside diphosphate kinase regulator [Ochrobactrum sp. PW1]